MQAWESLVWYCMCEQGESLCAVLTEVCLSLHVHTHTYTLEKDVCAFLIPDMWLCFTHTCTRLSVINTILPRSVGVQTVHYPRRLSNGWPVLLLKSHSMISELLFIFLESGFWTDHRDFLHNSSSTICAPDMNNISNSVAYWGIFWSKKLNKTKHDLHCVLPFIIAFFFSLYIICTFHIAIKYI